MKPKAIIYSGHIDC